MTGNDRPAPESDSPMIRRATVDRLLTLDRLQGLRFRVMAATPETGFLVLADLTGYTAYLSGSEIEHAPAIAGDLLETIVGRLEPPFRLAKFEGDAAFLFVEDGRADGVAPARRDRGRLPRLPPPTAEHRPGDDLRLQLVPAGAEARPQGVRPPWGLRLESHRRARRAGRFRCHRRPPIAEGRGRRRGASQRLRAVHGRRRRRARSRRRCPAAPARARRTSSTSAGSTRSRWTSRRAGRTRAPCAGSTSPTPISPSTSRRPSPPTHRWSGRT